MADKAGVPTLPDPRLKPPPSPMESRGCSGFPLALLLQARAGCFCPRRVFSLGRQDSGAAGAGSGSLGRGGTSIPISDSPLGAGARALTGGEHHTGQLVVALRRPCCSSGPSALNAAPRREKWGVPAALKLLGLFHSESSFQAAAPHKAPCDAGGRGGLPPRCWGNNTLYHNYDISLVCINL